MSVATPESVAEVADLIADARRTDTPMWFRGSGTVSAPTDHTVVSTEHFTGIVDYKPDDLTVVVRGGTTLGELEEVLAEYRQTAVLPETALSRTVGGVVASGTSGYRRLRYGPTRDRVIGVTIVTGYGEVIHGGGQLVKNVTGYDIPRLMTGSHGALGFVAEISLKLWPSASEPLTLRVTDPEMVRRDLYQPIAVLETEKGGSVYASGPVTSDHIESEADGFVWPEMMDSQVMVAINVPASLVGDAVGRARELGAVRFVAQHGIGVVDVGWDAVTDAEIHDLRTWAESAGGSVVIHRSGPLGDSLSRWGEPPDDIGIQTRLKDLFDPDRVCNPGVLPGGI